MNLECHCRTHHTKGTPNSISDTDLLVSSVTKLDCRTLRRRCSVQVAYFQLMGGEISSEITERVLESTLELDPGEEVVEEFGDNLGYLGEGPSDEYGNLGPRGFEHGGVDGDGSTPQYGDGTDIVQGEEQTGHFHGTVLEGTLLEEMPTEEPKIPDEPKKAGTRTVEDDRRVNLIGGDPMETTILFCIFVFGEEQIPKFGPKSDCNFEDDVKTMREELNLYGPAAESLGFLSQLPPCEIEPFDW